MNGTVVDRTVVDGTVVDRTVVDGTVVDRTVVDGKLVFQLVKALSPSMGLLYIDNIYILH